MAVVLIILRAHQVAHSSTANVRSSHQDTSVVVIAFSQPHLMPKAIHN